MTYHDRTSAGIALAHALSHYKNAKNTIVLGLPRGGIPVAFEVAKKLSLPLDAFIVRKIGAPSQPELAVGAIASGGISYFNHQLMDELGISAEDLHPTIQAEQQELQRREVCYRGNRALLSFRDKSIILVDDGIATGASIKAAIMALQQQKPKAIIVAVPVAAKSTCEALAPLVDRIICPLQPESFGAVGYWYEAFPQTSDAEVIALLQSHLT